MTSHSELSKIIDCYFKPDNTILGSLVAEVTRFRAGKTLLIREKEELADNGNN